MPLRAYRIAIVIPKYGLTGGAEVFTAELTERIALNPRYDIHVFANLWRKQIRRKYMSLNDYATDWVERKLVENKRCKTFLAPSGLAKESFLQTYGIDQAMVEIVHPGIDVGRFQRLDRRRCRREIRERYRIGNEDTLLLFVSMNFEIKGLNRLIMTLAALKSAHSREKFKLLVVGKGNVRKFSSLAKSLNIHDPVVFTEVMKKANLEKAYLASDMFSILSCFDTFGMVALEAMAASLPVIFSDTVGAKDLVIHGGNGFIAEEIASAQEIAGPIGLLMDREVRITMWQKAYGTALANTWEVSAGKVETLYEKLLSNPPHASPGRGGV